MLRGFKTLSMVFVLLLSGWSVTAQAADAPSIDTEITIPGWWVVGPFMSGVREAGTDALAFDRDAPQFKTPLLRPEYPSALVPGGDARWRWYEADADGTLTVDYPEVPEESMELVTDEWGFAGGYTVGYAYATLHIEDGPRRALMDLRHAGGLTINGIPWPGDPYGHGMGLTPVLLEDGDNELKVGIGSRQRFKLKLLPVEDDLIAFEQSATLPDLVRGEAAPVHFGLPLANTTNEWMSLSSASIKIGDWYAGELALDAVIAPLCIYNLPMTFASDADMVPSDIEEDKLPATITVSYAGGSTTAEINLDVREPNEARRVTFFSNMDRSVQYYGLLPPTDFDPEYGSGRFDEGYGLILSLHGAGVEAIGQARAYRPKDWAFVIAPTNRRRFGFDWQDWGQRDMLEVLTDVRQNYNIDRNRIHLTGHSMGGHGTWLNGLTYPDLWASVSPSAGWTRFDLYAPMFLRKNVLYGDPKANYLWNLAMRKDDPLAIAENGINLPFYVVEGGADDNVPPQQPRLLYTQLKRLGYDVEYEEVPGKGHWWGHPDTEGTDCIDSAKHNEFWETNVRDPWPKKVVLKQTGPEGWSSSCWIGMNSTGEDRAFGDRTVRAEVVDRKTISITTDNASTISIDFNEELIDLDSFEIHIDGQLFPAGFHKPCPYQHVFLKTAGKWSLEWCSEMFKYALKDPWYIRHNKSLQRPVEAVIGTAGDSETVKWNEHLARIYAYHWWYRGNGKVELVLDVDFVKREYVRKNVIALGGYESNLLVQRLDPIPPFDVGLSPCLIAGRDLTGLDLSYKAVYPYNYMTLEGELYTDVGVGDALIFIEGGTSLEALKRLPSMMGIYSGSGFPDWMIWEDEVKLRGLGGVVAMGFYNLDWEIDEDLTYINHDLINRLE